MNWYLPRSLKLTPGQKSLMLFTIFKMQIFLNVGTGKAIQYQRKYCSLVYLMRSKVRGDGCFGKLERKTYRAASAKELARE